MSALVEWITLCFTHWWPQMCHYSNIINFGSYRKRALQSNLIIPHCFLVHKKESIMQLLGYFIFYSAAANESATAMDASVKKLTDEVQTQFAITRRTPYNYVHNVRLLRQLHILNHFSWNSGHWDVCKLPSAPTLYLVLKIQLLQANKNQPL